MDVGTILGLIIVGTIIGVVARLIVPGPNPIGILLTIALGVVGALIGGWLGAMIGAGMVFTWLIGIVIAVVLVALVSGWRGRGRLTSTGI